MIKAYHQVGTDSMERAARSELLAHVIKIESLLPATQRVRRSEMEEECFGDADAMPLHSRFARSNTTTITALRQIARAWVEKLPENGTTHTLFNCVDILAGDLDRIFMSIGNWYSVDTGFVFDAEELMRKGASFRPTDLLGPLDFNIERISKATFPSVYEAKVAIQETIDEVLKDHSWSGKKGLSELQKCFAGEGKYYKSEGCVNGELVWDGPLPLELAVEAWDNGTRIG